MNRISLHRLLKFVRPRKQWFRLYCQCKSESKEEKFMWCQTAYNEPKVVLYDGSTMPIIGLGTWQSKEDEATEAVKIAIDAGYRHIDCAQIYQNEPEVGKALEAKIKEGIVKREELFVTSKLWNTFHRRDLVRMALEQTLDDLKLQYLDLFLIHWPMAYKEGCALIPTDKKGNVIFSPVDYVDTWSEMEKLIDAGLTKKIGISNFNRRQITRLLENAKIPPFVNQIECHPYLQQKKLSAFCKLNNINVIAYSPLGAPARPWAKESDPNLLQEQKLTEIAEKKEKSVAQILIRYQIQRGNIVIPKSVTKEHIECNLKVFDFELTAEEIQSIESLEKNLRFVSLLTEAGNHKYYPFHDEY